MTLGRKITFNEARNILAIMFYGTEEGMKINRVLCDVDENPWHTGTPTEEGWYIIKLAVSDAYFTNYWEAEGKWRIAMNYNFYAWQKIEPYKEK